MTMATYTSRYPPQQNSDYVKAYYYASDSYPWYATDPNKNLTGGAGYNSWKDNAQKSNQRFHIDLGQPFVIRRIYYENFHDSGNSTERGAKNFTLWGSNSADAFNNLDYNDDTGWTQIPTEEIYFQKHIAADQEDPHYILVNNATPYRYYAIKIADNYGDTAYIGLRRIELQTEDGYSGRWRKIILDKENHLALTPASRTDVPAEAGVLYIDKDDTTGYINTDGTWQKIGKLNAIKDDDTPKLGGNLDTNGFQIVNGLIVDGNPVLVATASEKIIYVDNTNGDDTNGDGSENNPYASISRALEDIPDSITKSITIHIKASTTKYGSLILSNKVFTNTDGSLTIEGEMSQLDNGTISGYVYSATDPEYPNANTLKVTDDSKNWTSNQFKYKLLHIFDDNGFDFYTIIDSNDATNLYCSHMYYGDITNKSYEILDWATQIESIYLSALTGPVTVQKLWVNSSSNKVVNLNALGKFVMKNSRIDKNYDGASGFYFTSSDISLTEIYLEGHDTNYDGIVGGYGNASRLYIAGTKIHNFRYGINLSGTVVYGFFRGGGRIIADNNSSIALRGILLNGPANMSFYSSRGKVVISGYPTGIAMWGLSKIQYDNFIVFSDVVKQKDMFSALDYAGDYEIKGNFRIRPVSAAPSDTPDNGGVLYVQNGALYYRGSNGTITKLGDA